MGFSKTTKQNNGTDTQQKQESGITDMTKKAFAILGATIAGGLGISLVSLLPNATEAGLKHCPFLIF